MRELALFAGGGGGLLGSQLLGWSTRCAVELDPYARSILLARQRDGLLEPFPIWDDVKTFDGRPWRGSIEVVSGGFPCKDISAAGRGAGITGENSGLFFEMLRIIKEVRPRFILAENSPNLRTRGLVTVIKELDGLGYECRWGVLGAWHVGAPHKRNRMWIVGKLSNADKLGVRIERGSQRLEKGRNRETAPELKHDGGALDVADAARIGREKQRRTGPVPPQLTPVKRGSWWAVEPGFCRVAHGVANRVDRLKALGNGQVPAVAVLAWEILGGDLC